MFDKFDQLLYVVPVVQTYTTDDTTVTLFSLELFADGMRLRGRVTTVDRRVESRQNQSTAPFLIPAINFRAADDLGDQYQLTAGGASGTLRRMEFAAVSRQPLSSSAKELRLELTEILWRDVGKNNTEGIIRVQPVHWTFTVPTQRPSS